MPRIASLPLLAALALACPAHARDFVGGDFSLNLDGVSAGIVQKVEGGDVAAEVVEEPVAGLYYPKKHIGDLHYEDFSLATGLDVSGALGEWIKNSLEGNYIRKNGAITPQPSARQARAIREFTGALISEIGFPAADGSAKEPAYLSVKFSPETVRFRPAGKDDGAGGTPRRAQPVTAVLCADGLPCVPLLALGAIRVRLPPPPPPQVEVAPAHAGISNLEFAIAADRAGPWEQWFRDFVTDGDNDDSKEKSGTLIYLDASRERELARVDFFHLGIFKLTSDPATNDEDKIKRVRVALYVEQLDVRFGGFCERCD